MEFIFIFLNYELGYQLSFVEKFLPLVLAFIAITLIIKYKDYIKSNNKFRTTLDYIILV